jgi:hypothetical protein
VGVIAGTALLVFGTMFGAHPQHFPYLFFSTALGVPAASA